MALEIERKFKVTRIRRQLRGGGRIVQGYLCFDPEVRVRIKDRRGYVTIKRGEGLERREFEYEIPLRDATEILELTDFVIEKKRYKVGRLEIDKYIGAHKGLVIAEVELKHKRERIQHPPWIDWIEVTGDPKYLNKNLARYGLPGKNDLSIGQLIYQT